MAGHADDSGPSVRGLVEEGLEDALRRVRGERGRFGDRASQALTALLSELGVVQRREYEELELRIAQLEHRLRLLEDRADGRRAVTASDDEA